jgi:hypothetical protein
MGDFPNWTLLKEITRKSAKERRRINANKYGDQLSRTNWHNIVYCKYRRDEEEFWIGVETFLQRLYDSRSPRWLNPYCAESNRGFSSLIHKILCEKYNRNEFKVQFKEL